MKVVAFLSILVLCVAFDNTMGKVPKKRINKLRKAVNALKKANQALTKDVGDLQECVDNLKKDYSILLELLKKLNLICVQDNTIYFNGQKFLSSDGCNDCTCEDGGAVSCTEKACINQGCPPVPPSRRLCQVMDTCEQPRCPNGTICCPSHCGSLCKPALCPDPTGMIGNCGARCSSDMQCPEGRRCCSNGCGSACLVPVPDYCPGGGQISPIANQCGRGGLGPCPPGFYCENSPVDAYAVCCPIRDSKCGNGMQPLVDKGGNELFCGRGMNSVTCPKGSTCVTHPSDRWAVCCPVP